MLNNRGHPIEKKNIVSVIFTIAVIIMVFGFLIAIPQRTDTSGNSAVNDTDTVDEEITLFYTFSEGDLSGVSYSENVNNNDAMWVNSENLNGEEVLAIGKNSISESAQCVWLDLLNVDETFSKFTLELDFMTTGIPNGFIGLPDYESGSGWFTSFQMQDADGIFINSFFDFYLYATSVTDQTYSVHYGGVGTSVSLNEWNHLKIEYDKMFTIYVNDVLVYNKPLKDFQIPSILQIKNRGYANGTQLYLDNIAVTAVK